MADEFLKTNNEGYYSENANRRSETGLLLGISIILCSVMLLCNVILALSMMQIASSLRVDSVILTKQNSSSEMVDVEPVFDNMNNIDILNEIMVKKYILLRHNILNNAPVMKFNWDKGGLLHFLSSPSVYAEFFYGSKDKDKWDKEHMKRLLNDISRGNQLPSEVEFIDINKEANNLWKVDFDTIEYNDMTDKGSRKHWRAYVTITNDTSRILYAKRVVNPLGFVVIDYDLAPKTAK